MAKNTENSGNAESGKPGDAMDDVKNAFLDDLGDAFDDEEESEEEETDEDEDEDSDEEDEDSDDKKDDEEESDEDEPKSKKKEAEEDELSDEEEDEESEDELAKIGHKTVTVLIDGKREKVTVSEAAQGYMRTKAFTQKTMDLAEKRKAAEAAQETYSGLVVRLTKHLDTLLKPENEPDWDALRAEDPAEYAAKRQDWKDLQEQREAAAEETKRLDAQTRKKSEEDLEAYLVEQETKLLDALPGWKKDKELAARESRAIRSFMQKEGFNDAEIKNLVDHRAILIIRKAALYDRQKSKVNGKLRLEKGAKTLTPRGKNETVRERGTSGIRKAEARLAKTGRTEDLAAIFLHDLKNEK